MSEKSSELNKEKILSFLREHKEQLHENFGVTKIALFGSYARGDQGPESDVDVAIEALKHEFRNRLRLKEFLEQHFHTKVDVVYLKSMRAFIRRSIEEDLAYA